MEYRLDSHTTNWSCRFKETTPMARCHPIFQVYNVDRSTIIRCWFHLKKLTSYRISTKLVYIEYRWSKLSTKAIMRSYWITLCRQESAVLSHRLVDLRKARKEVIIKLEWINNWRSTWVSQTIKTIVAALIRLKTILAYSSNWISINSHMWIRRSTMNFLTIRAFPWTIA